MSPIEVSENIGPLQFSQDMLAPLICNKYGDEMAQNELSLALEELASAIDAQSFKAVASDTWGWQSAALSADDLARMARSLASEVAGSDWSLLPNEKQVWLTDITDRVRRTTGIHVPNLGGGYMALDPVINVLFAVDVTLRGLVDTRMMRGALQSMGALTKKAAAVSSDLDARMKEMEAFADTAAKLTRAASLAEKLDVTTSELDEALKQVSAAHQNTLKFQLEAEGAVGKTIDALRVTEHFAGDAAAVMKKIDAAYGAATTQGLAKSFDEKAKELNHSMIVWTVVLFIALLIGVFVGQDRFPQLIKALDGKTDLGVVAMHMLIGVLSLAPGVWLAWLATKQIGQRFRLAEDYGYKASLAKAYEGYRKQAEGLDPMFSAQLFAIALGRLEELPLRTIDRDISGSPLNDLLQSREFRNQMEKVPGLKDAVIGLLQRSVPQPIIDVCTGKNAKGGQKPEE